VNRNHPPTLLHTKRHIAMGGKASTAAGGALTASSQDTTGSLNGGQYTRVSYHNTFN